MKNIKPSILMIPFGLILVVIAAWLMLSGMADGGVTGILFGLGSGLFGTGCAYNIENRVYKNNPQLCKKKIIEQNDERNIAIRNKARAKSGTILMYLNILLAVIMSALHIELWAVLSLLLVTFLHSLCTAALIVKYNKV